MKITAALITLRTPITYHPTESGAFDSGTNLIIETDKSVVNIYVDQYIRIKIFFRLPCRFTVDNVSFKGKSEV